jgi:hypothetical protein
MQENSKEFSASENFNNTEIFRDPKLKFQSYFHTLKTGKLIFSGSSKIIDF